ncbi:MAG: hypothetical protein C4522_03825 [Desulfobacteraceae bacterium]|nr:MAG: hypothetical protein C4522_03825 [Desulfobacteraceae bacterium]
MNDNIEKEMEQKKRELLEQRRRLLSMPAEKALDAIMDTPDPLPLVHSFSGEDFYFFIHDIGIDDALPILSMASKSQWEYILDVEIWQRDRISLQPVLKWFDLLLKADEDRLIQWVQDEKLELFEFCLLKTIEVRIREHDEDPSVFGDGFSTVDGIFYIRFLDHPADPPEDDGFSREKEEIVDSLLKKLADTDHVMYQKILFEFAGMLPAEAEEEIYRWRNVRMAEKGFLPFEEAIGIYQPLPEKIRSTMREKTARPESSREKNIPLSLYPVSAIAGEDLFSRTMNQTDLAPGLESEFAVLCNTIISADRKTIRGKEELAEIVAKACGYVSIGLQHLSGGAEKPHVENLLSLISEYPLSSFFKIGYGLVLELKWRTDRWLKKSWFQENRPALGFWGEEWMGVLGGLLLKKPLYYDNYETGKLYREFASIDDVRKTEKAVSDVFRFDTLFSVLNIVFEPITGYFVTYKNVLLTLWARDRLGLENKPAPVELDDRFKSFFDGIFEESIENRQNEPQADEPLNRRITTHAKTAFVHWIAARTGWSDREITERYGNVFDALFRELENEYGGVSANNLDPRYVRMFLLGYKKESGHL